nr:hypothetical protein [Corallococcus exiguus]
MDDGLHPHLLGVGANALGVIAGVREEGVAFGVHQQFLGHRGLMLLSGRQREVERLTARRCDGVNLR